MYTIISVEYFLNDFLGKLKIFIFEDFYYAVPRVIWNEFLENEHLNNNSVCPSLKRFPNKSTGV